MDSRLAIELDRVAFRVRRLLLWRGLCACWLAAAALAVALLFVAGLTAWSSRVPLLVVVLAAGGLAVFVCARARRATSDPRVIARHIERRFPDLDNRLLAAVEQGGGWPSGEYSYLQGVVIGEAVRHGRFREWSDTVPDQQLTRARLAHFISLAVLAASLAGLGILPAQWEERGAGPFGWTIGRNTERYRVVVEPGNTAIERGTDLLVLARFAGPIPSNVSVAYGPNGDAVQRLPLPKSLDDPLFGGRIATVQNDLVYRVEFDDQRSDEFRVTVFDYPTVERLDAEIAFPEYTAIPPKRIEDTRQVSVVEGSSVTLICRLNKPVQRAWVTDRHNQPTELAIADNPAEYRLTVLARESQRYAIHLLDAENRFNKLPPEFVLTVVPNRPPELVLKFPGRDTAVSPIEELTLQATAWDDFGLRAYGLTYGVGAQPRKSLTLGESVAGKEKREIEHTLLLEALEAKPDELISYHFWAEDIGPNGQPRRAMSDMFFAEVRHFEEIYRQGQQPSESESQQAEQQAGGARQQQMTQLADLQKQIINATWKLIRQQTGPELTENFVNDADVVRQSQQTALEQTEALNEKVSDATAAQMIVEVEQHMQTALDQLSSAADTPVAAPLTPALSAEQAAYQALLKLRAREHEVVRSRSRRGQASAGGANRADRQLQELELDSRENRYEAQRTAAPQQQQANREDNQVLNRLRELARRQEDLNKRIKELQSALEEAKDEAKKEEIRRQLERLREEQQEMLRDLDELRDRMDQPENQQRMADARRELEQTRSNLRQASEALREGQLSQSLTSGTRAQRELEQVRDEFRKRTANQFSDDMREMRDRARRLAEREQSLGEQLDGLKDAPRQSLRDDGRKQVAEELGRQTERLQELTEQMKSVSEEAEPSEPLLSKQLYDTLRDTHQRNIDESMRMTAELLRHGFLSEADQTEEKVRKDIDQVRKGVERAARSVLGDPAEATRRAIEELDELTRQVEREIAKADPTSNQERRASTAEQREGPARSGQSQDANQPTPAGDQPANEQNRTPPSDSPQSGSRAAQKAADASAKSKTGTQPAKGERNGQPGNRPATPGTDRGFDAAGWTGPGGPITGSEYRDWSDRLREVEEMLEDHERRAEVAEIREQARSMRGDLKRHSKEPNWSLVRSLIAEPLVELQTKLREDLARMESHDKLVPIDRDPVPRRYSEQVRRYYERLGSGK